MAFLIWSCWINISPGWKSYRDVKGLITDSRGEFEHREEGEGWFDWGEGWRGVGWGWFNWGGVGWG